MDTISLYQLNQHLKQVIALNFEEFIWISAEISQCRNTRGHWYLELVEKDTATDMVIAQISAVIWAGEYRQLQNTIGSELDNLLQPGTQVRLLVETTFHERYGLKLTIRNIDLQYTMGNLELQKRATLERLAKENLLELNSKTILPNVIQRIAVISSASAAGYKDFINQLIHNNFQYSFQIHLFDASMQGQNVNRDVTKHLGSFNSGDWDCVVIIRGGGSKLDLSDFDEYSLAKAIALCEIPVLTGIGHEIDTSIADMVAHTAVKTPTAAAAFILDRSKAFEELLTDLQNAFIEITQTELYRHSILQTQLSARLINAYKLMHEKELERNRQYNTRLKLIADQSIKKGSYELESLASTLKILDYRNALKRGFTMLTKNDKPVKTIHDLREGDQIKQLLIDGTILSTINKINNGKES